MTNTITLKAFNNLPGVTISNFQLPSDDPAGGITISTNSLIPSPAHLGIDMGMVTFQAYFDNTLIGPLTATNLVLPPEAQVTSHLVGRMVPQSGNGLDVIGQLFSEYLTADNITLSVTGESVQPTGASSPVTWLSDAFHTLTLAVTLPGQKFDIIQSIALMGLGLTMEDQQEAFAPLSGSNDTVAEYKNPFGFSLQVIQSAVNMTLSVGGISAASVSAVAFLVRMTSVPLVSLDEASFEAMFAEVTDQNSATFGLSGTADVTAKTPIGDVPISGIPFDVSTTLQGINSFDGTATTSNVIIAGSGGTNGDQYIVTPLTTVMNNPSNVSLSTKGIALLVYHENVMIGHVAFDTFNLIPGENTMSGEFHYEPADANDTIAELFLTSFVQASDVLLLTVRGDSASSPFNSLNPAFEGVTLHTSVTRLNVPPIITHLYATVLLATLVTNEIQLSFDIYNPLEAELTIEFVQADGLINGEIYAHFEHAFSNFIIPPGETVNSGTFSNVVLTQGVVASLGIIPLGYMDVQAVSTTRIGVNGYQVPWLHVNQMNVITDYSFGPSSSSASTSKAPTSSSPSSKMPALTSASASATGAANSTHG